MGQGNANSARPEGGSGASGPRPCPACGATSTEVFYRVPRTPVHQHLLYPSREEAVNCPRGSIELTSCAGCGFVFNAAFDAGLLSYSDRYENTQAYSGVFSTYMRDLADYLVERFDLHGKRLIEVGSGAGTFLELLCELGGNKGIGFDPAHLGRETEPPPGVEFIPDFYSDRYVGRPADFVYSRHVLEHISEPAEMMRTIRRSIGDRVGTPIFLEVPDVSWILREGAFWDIFYEHCSYFGESSVAGLLTSSGFDSVRIQTRFAGQYLWAEARAGEPSPPPPDGPDRVVTLATEFAEKAEGVRSAVGAYMDAVPAGSGSCVIWGAGAKGVTLLNTVGSSAEAVAAVVDLNPRKQGNYVAGSGHPIVAPDALSSIRPEKVILTNPNYLEEIRDQLKELGLEPELHSIHAGRPA